MTEADDLKMAHAQLVKQRHSIIEALAKGYERGQTEDHIDLLLKIQAAIEVLDTLADEEVLDMLADEDEDEEDDE
jgi:hypothetical protein